MGSRGRWARAGHPARTLCGLIIALVAVLAGGAPVGAEGSSPAAKSTPGPTKDAKEPSPAEGLAWHSVAALGLVSVTGNAESTNLSFNDTLTAQWPVTLFELKLRAVRVDTSKRNVEADFTDPASPALRVSRTDQRTTEEYSAKARVNRKVSERLGWFVAGSWERNRPAGLASRSSFGGGLSYTVPEPRQPRHKRSLQFEAGFDATRESPVEGIIRTYVGARVASRLSRELSQTTLFQGSIELLENLEETQDLRINVETTLSTAINSRLALKVSYVVNYDRRPQFTRFANPEPDIGPDLIFYFDEVDAVFSTSFVMKW